MMDFINKIEKIAKQNENKVPIFIYGIIEYLLWFKNFFFNKHKLSSPNVVYPFFIIGSGRSGNTLLRSILTSNSKISIPPESYVFHSIYRKFKIYGFLDWADLAKTIVSEFESHKGFYHWNINLSPVYQRIINLDRHDRTLAKIIDEVYKYYAEKKAPNAIIWGDKTPLNTLYLPWISKIFPNAKYIHIIRDGRDVVSSYLKSELYDNIEDICWRWNESINRSKKFKQSIPSNQYLEIRYEHLVCNPEKEIKIICKFLEINFEENMLNYYLQSNKLGDVEKLNHHKNVMKPINKKSIGKYKNNLTNKQIKIIHDKLRKNLSLLGYD